MGFSQEHSTQVALVRNLITGKVSPQYHVVFDDKFETVFGVEHDPEVVARIDAEIWANGHDCYAEEEYDADGNLIYSPPPLEEQWLTADEREKAKAAAREQRERHKQLVDERKANTPGNDASNRKRYRDIDLVSDDEDDSLSLEDADDESEGELSLDDDHDIIQPRRRPRHNPNR